MHLSIRPLIAVASLFALSTVHAAQVNWSTSPGLNDNEVSTQGTQLFGYYYSAAGGPATVLVNSVPFTLQTGQPTGLEFNGGYNNIEGMDLYQVASNGNNSGLNQILDGQNWGGAVPLTVTGLTPGQPYQLQFMVSDDRPGFNKNRNFDVSDGDDPEGLRDIERAYHSTSGTGLPAGATAGSREAKIFTGNFIADSTGTQNIFNTLYENENHTGGNSGSQVNAIQVRAVPEPSSILMLAGATAGLLAFRRRRSLR